MTFKSILTCAGFSVLLTLFPGKAQAHPEMCYPICTPNCHLFCEGIVDAWGVVISSQAGQPATGYACDATHPCQITSQGTLSAQTLFNAGGDVGEGQPFTAVETIDYTHPTPNGAGGSCYPVNGDLTITDANDNQSTLAMHFQGQGCQIGSDASALLVDGAYDFEDTSVGRFKGVSGLGHFNHLSPVGTFAPSSSTPNTNYALSFTGNLHFPSAAQLAAKALAKVFLPDGMPLTCQTAPLIFAEMIAALSPAGL
jgi:hypothetical protein